MQAATTVKSHTTTAPTGSPALRLLADHLDAVLRHGEALRALERPAAIGAFDGPGVPAMLRRSRQIADIAQRAHALELAIVLRLTQARQTASDAKAHAQIGVSALKLVAVACDLVADAVATDQLQSTTDTSGFFASRTVADQTGPLGEDYLIGAKTPLGAVMDAAAAALDVIDLIDNTGQAHRRLA